MRKLGHQQKLALGFLCDFNGWFRHPIPAWNIVYSSMTERILETLAPHGLAEKTPEGYIPTDLGRQVNEGKTP